jgi:hypothetical protein
LGFKDPPGAGNYGAPIKMDGAPPYSLFRHIFNLLKTYGAIWVTPPRNIYGPDANASKKFINAVRLGSRR